MKSQDIESLLGGLTEQLAAIEHERWSRWQRYVHNKGVRQLDGTLLLSPDLVARWEKQIETKYIDLSEAEKESDREQVRKYLPLIVSALTSRVDAEEGTLVSSSQVTPVPVSFPDHDDGAPGPSSSGT
jgi:hypothetical protein